MTVDSAALEEFDYYEDIEDADWFLKYAYYSKYI
jgi:hypothetical protein